MKNYTLRPIPLFTDQRDKSLSLHRLEIGKQHTSCGYIWLIEGASDKIVIDAGPSIDFIAKVRKYACEEIQTVDAGLRKLGTDCSDIDLVIVTHLHHDHIGQASHFSKARFLVQWDELEFARNPHRYFSSSFVEEFFEGLNYEVIKGDFEVCEGLSVMSTPGHTKGGQSVSVRTDQGLAVVSGICTIQENFEPQLIGQNLPVIPTSAHYDLLQTYDSLLRIKETADIVVANHDAKYMHVDSIP